MQTLQVKSKKGGIGKSLFSREFAQFLAALGFNVILIDTSEQANDDILENQHRKFPYTLKECIIDEVPIFEAIRQVRKHLWLLAGSRDHEDINDHIRKARYQTMVKDMIDELQASLTPAQPFDERFPWWNQERVSLNIFHSEPTIDEEFSAPPEFIDFYPH